MSDMQRMTERANALTDKVDRLKKDTETSMKNASDTLEKTSGTLQEMMGVLFLLRLQRNLLVLFVLVLLVAVTSQAFAGEREYQLSFCDRIHGQAEVVLSDRSRVDCLGETHAIEVDFAPKWAEAIGQSLHYSALTGKAPGVALILTNTQDNIHMKRLFNIIRVWRLPIQVWVIRGNPEQRL